MSHGNFRLSYRSNDVARVDGACEIVLNALCAAVLFFVLEKKFDGSGVPTNNRGGIALYEQNNVTHVFRSSEN